MASPILVGVAVLVAGLLMCAETVTRDLCMHRIDGKVGFHRRVDPEHLLALEREMEIGPAGLDAKLARLERKEREAETLKRPAVKAKTGMTFADMKEAMGKVFGMPPLLIGLTREYPECVQVVNPKLWQEARYSGSAHPRIPDPTAYGADLEVVRLEPDGRTLWVAPALTESLAAASQPIYMPPGWKVDQLPTGSPEGIDVECL